MKLRKFVKALTGIFLLRKYRFLFLLEREFHISLFENLIHYIREQELGIIGIFSTSFRPSLDGKASSGARLSKVADLIGYDFVAVNTPKEFDPDISFFADTPSEYDGHLGFKVCIGHGTICKGSFYTKSTRMRRDNYADLVCVPGSIHKEILSKNIFKPVEITGIPKLDNIYTGKIDNNEIFKKLELSPEKRTLLFAPTYNKEFSLIPWLKKSFRDYFPEYTNVIIKLHGVEREDIKAYFKKLAVNDESISYCENHNIAECFAVSDLLVSDVSSVVYEFASLGKPVLIFDSPLMKTHPKYDENDLEYRFRDVGVRFSNPDNLKHLILQTLMLPETRDDIYDQFISVRNGTSSELVVKKAIEYLGNRSFKPGLFITKSDNGTHLKLKKRFEREFAVVIIDSEEDIDDEESILDLTVLNGNFEYSPMLPSFLKYHHKYKKTEIVIPMISAKFGLPEQGVVNYHPQARGVKDSLIGNPVVSSSPGESRKYDSEFIPLAFSYSGKDRNTLKILIDACNNMKKVKLPQKSVLIAEDCFIY